MPKNYKLLNLIATLSQTEQRQFRKFIQSSYVALREDVKNIYEILIQYVKKRKPFPKLEVLFTKVFPGEAYNALKLRGSMSDLLEILENFLIINLRKENKIENHLLLARIYRERKIEKNYNGNFQELNNLIQKQTLQNADFYRHQLAFLREQMMFQTQNKRTEHLFFQEISDTQDILYLSEKLNNACSKLSHQLVYKTDYDYSMLHHLLDFIEHEKYLDHPAISIYYYCVRFLTSDDNKDYFQKFKVNFFKHKSKFAKADLVSPYRLAINYCIRKMNEGEEAFIKEGWEFYKEGLAESILIENNFIPRFTFNNMIAMAISLKEYDWVSQFVKENSDLLEPKYREQTVCFNLARLAFAKEEYEAALGYLQEVEYNDLVNILIVKMMIIKVYFEIGADDALFSNLDSFGQFIRRREVSDYHKTNFLNIIKFIKKIKNTPPSDKQAFKELKQAILKTTLVSESSWLLEKIDRKL